MFDSVDFQFHYIHTTVINTGIAMRTKVLLSALLIIAIFYGLSSAKTYPTGGVIFDETSDLLKQSPPIRPLFPYDESCDNSANLPPIGNQGNQNSCTCWASAYYMRTYVEWQERGWDVNVPEHQFSPAFVYNQINGGNNGPIYMPDIFTMFCDNGCAALSDMPYHDWDWQSQPNEQSYSNGIYYRCEDWFTISFIPGLTEIKNYLLNGNVAVMGIYVYESMFDLQNYNNTYCLSNYTGPYIGNHVVTLCGFDDDMHTADGTGAFKLANSWGTAWGDGGYFWMSYEAVQSSALSFRQAYYLVDKIAYAPSFTAKFKIAHNDCHTVYPVLSISDFTGTNWSKTFLQWNRPSIYQVPFTQSNIVVDLTDGIEFLHQDQLNIISIQCIDTDSDDTSGVLQYFSVSDLTIPAGAVSFDAPLNIPDYGSVFANTLFDYNMDAPPPANLSYEVDNISGLVSFDWDFTYSGSDFVAFFIYRNGIFIGNTTNTEYTDDISTVGQYVYNITACYTARESESIDATISWPTQSISVGGFSHTVNSCRLYSPSPNPFNQQAVLRFELASEMEIDMAVFDIAGRKTSEISSGNYSAGEHRVVWHAAGTPSGVYFVRLKAGGETETVKIVLMK